MDNLTVAAVQISPGPDRGENIIKALELMESAVEKGAKIISLPEDFSNSGVGQEKLSFATRPEHENALHALRKFAKNYQVSIVAGSIPFISKHKDKVSNSCMVIDDTGEIIARYDKIHLFDVELDMELLEDIRKRLPSLEHANKKKFFPDLS